MKDLEIYAGVFGNPNDTDDCFLIPHPLDMRAIEYAADHGMKFCGTMGWIHGEAHARCIPNEKAVLTMMSAVPAFARYVASRIKGLPKEFAVGTASA
jgi:hypothetical protein